MEKIFFQTWDSLARTGIIGICSYLSLIFILRVVGNRTLSQLHAFDFIVTVALGSTLATVILNKDVALADGILALGLLVVLQLSISWLSVKYKTIRQFIKTEPRLIFYRGRYLDEQLNKSRLTKGEILQVIRENGVGTIEDVEAIVLETNGKFSVITKLRGQDNTVLENVTGMKA